MSVFPELIVITGPTASGKTSVGIDLARELGGEIVSADARQIYRYMDIGTAKPTPAEQQAAPHHLIDVVNPDEPYSAGRFAREAAEVILAIQQRGNLPILVGGSGFYVRALLDGFSPIPEIPSKVRHALLEQATRDLDALYRELQKVDPGWAQRVHPNDTQRVVRGMEVFQTTGERLSDFQRRPREPAGHWRTAWFGLNMDRQALYQRIEDRADAMVAAGLLEEVQSLRERGYTPELNALNTFGYREFFDPLEGKGDLSKAVDEMKTGTRRFAKRQMTWFRAEPRLTWIDPLQEDSVREILTACHG